MKVASAVFAVATLSFCGLVQSVFFYPAHHHSGSTCNVIYSDEGGGFDRNYGHFTSHDNNLEVDCPISLDEGGENGASLLYVDAHFRNVGNQARSVSCRLLVRDEYGEMVRRDRKNNINLPANDFTTVNFDVDLGQRGIQQGDFSYIYCVLAEDSSIVSIDVVGGGP